MFGRAERRVGAVDLDAGGATSAEAEIAEGLARFGLRVEQEGDATVSCGRQQPVGM